MKFKNPYINRCLNALQKNNINIYIVSIEKNKLIKSAIVNSELYHIKRDLIKLSYNKKIYKFTNYDTFPSFLKDIVDLNYLYEKVFTTK